MSKEAQDLIDKMIQINPSDRLGHNLESIALLKQHPFFNGVNFEEISQKKHKAIYELIQQQVMKS